MTATDQDARRQPGGRLLRRGSFVLVWVILSEFLRQALQVRAQADARREQEQA